MPHIIDFFGVGEPHFIIIRIFQDRGSCWNTVPQVGRRGMQLKPNKDSSEHERFRFPNGFNGYWIAFKGRKDQPRQGVISLGYPVE